MHMREVVLENLILSCPKNGVLFLPTFVVFTLITRCMIYWH